LDTVPLNPDQPQPPVPASGAPRPAAARRPMRPPTRLERLEAWASRLSIKNNFFHQLFSLVWLPYAARSGIKMYQKKKDLAAERFAAILPFRRFNRNWYNAMAGAALLGNSEIAAGMYIFKACGGEYTVVCKNLEYRFLRPCYGPALYRITPRENLKELLSTGGEFNVSLDLEIVQAGLLPRRVQSATEMVSTAVSNRTKEKRVGRSVATFHVTPKAHQQAKGRQVRRTI
jgi:hypothetical protein